MKKIKVLGLILLSSAAMPVFAGICKIAADFVFALTESVDLAFATYAICATLLY